MVSKLFLLSLIAIVVGCGRSKSGDVLFSDISFVSCRDTSYTFSLESSSHTEHILDIVVRVGVMSDEMRKYAFFVTDDGDATLNDYRVESNSAISPHSLTDTIRVVLRRNMTLKTEGRLLVLRLVSNSHFRVSDDCLLRVHFDDIEVVPRWWAEWESQFGVYLKEKYVVWKEIYKRGLDDGGYYWDNMPPYAMSEYYPTTFFYIGKLRRYFEDNVVYPDGDTTLERILL